MTQLLEWKSELFRGRWTCVLSIMSIILKIYIRHVRTQENVTQDQEKSSQQKQTVDDLYVRVSRQGLYYRYFQKLNRKRQSYWINRKWNFRKKIKVIDSMVKHLLQWGRPGFDTWVGKIPWRREWLPTPVFLPGESHGKHSCHGILQYVGLQRIAHDWATNTLLKKKN